MQRIASYKIQRATLLLLSFFSGFVFAEPPSPGDYLNGESLLLEIRFCECQATDSVGEPPALLPAFLEDSTLLQIGIAKAEPGFASTGGLAMGYEIKPLSGSINQFAFSYAGSFSAHSGTSAGNGELVLVPEQWVILFGSQHDSSAGSHASGVAVRLVEPVSPLGTQPGSQ